MPSFGNFLHTQLVLKIPQPTTSFASKTVIVTGASSGLGKEAAKHIVRLGASKVILGCRNTSKGNQAKLEIESSLRCSPDIIEVWTVDLESPSSVKGFVDKANKLPRLDVLINNAGLWTAQFTLVYGTERTIAVNVIGTFLLALQLVPKLRETAREFGVTPHLTFVGSALYDVAKYPEDLKRVEDIFDWFGDEKHVDKMEQYNISKLLLLYGIIKLSSLIDPQPTSSKPTLTTKSATDTLSNQIVINSLDPCFCKSGLAGDLTGALKVFQKIFTFLFARTAEEGARLVVITASAGRETHGKYMRAGKVQEYMEVVTSAEGKGRMEVVWEGLVRRVEGLRPGVMEAVSG